MKIHKNFLLPWPPLGLKKKDEEGPEIMPEFLIVLCIYMYVVYLLLLLYIVGHSLGAFMYLETKNINIFHKSRVYFNCFKKFQVSGWFLLPKKCLPILYAVNLWLKPVSATGPRANLNLEWSDNKMQASDRLVQSVSPDPGSSLFFNLLGRCFKIF